MVKGDVRKLHSSFFSPLLFCEEPEMTWKTKQVNAQLLFFENASMYLFSCDYFREEPEMTRISTQVHAKQNFCSCLNLHSQVYRHVGHQLLEWMKVVEDLPSWAEQLPKRNAQPASEKIDAIINAGTYHEARAAAADFLATALWSGKGESTAASSSRAPPRRSTYASLVARPEPIAVQQEEQEEESGEVVVQPPAKVRRTRRE
jgi:hypothetical protein